MYCYSNNGLSMREVGEGYVAAVGEVLSPSILDPSELPNLFPAHSAAMSRVHAIEQIALLEALETKRRVAEAMPDDAGGTAEGRAWMAANRVAIEALRALL
jgi:hypothetical protein